MIDKLKLAIIGDNAVSAKHKMTILIHRVDHPMFIAYPPCKLKNRKNSQIE